MLRTTLATTLASPAPRAAMPHRVWPALARAHAPQGFTLVELVVTLIVVGILAVVALPRMDGLTGYAEITYRDQVRAALEYARKAAVAQRRNVRVSVASNSITLTIASDTPEGPAALTFNRSLSLPGTSSNILSAPPGVSISPTPTLTIDPLGRPSAGATLAITNAGNVTLEAQTGYVH